MPNYEYECLECNHVFTENLPVAERDIFAQIGKCPKCEQKKQKGLKRSVTAGSFVYDRVKSPAKRAGSGWNDTLLRIKSGSGKDNTIRTR